MLAGNRMFIRIKCMMIDFREREVVYERFVKGDEKALELLYESYFCNIGSLQRDVSCGR